MRRKIIYVNKVGRPSMKNVFRDIPDSELFIKSSLFDGFVHRHNGKKTKMRGLEKPDFRGETTVISWGSRAPILTDEKTIIYNDNEAIKRVSSKGECRRFLRENNVPIPVTYFPDENFDNIKFPAICRPEFHGRARAFFICHNFKDIENALKRGCTYISELYPKTEEYRVHILNLKVLACLRKPPPRDKNVIPWNKAVNNEPFVLVKPSEWNPAVIKTALNFCLKTQLSFGGIDLMCGAGDGYPPAVVCEGNVSPTINSSPFVTSRYIKAFKWLFASDKKRESWNPNSFMKIESLYWKSFQLEEGFTIPEEHQLRE